MRAGAQGWRGGAGPVLAAVSSTHLCGEPKYGRHRRQPPCGSGCSAWVWLRIGLLRGCRGKIT